MNSRNIGKSLKKIMDDYIGNIEDEKIKKIIKSNAIITGGALVSLLNNEAPNDYDIYFKDFKSTLYVANYYINMWIKDHKEISPSIHLMIDEYVLVNIIDENTLYLRYIKDEETIFLNINITEYLLDHDGRISIYIKSEGAVIEKNETGIDDPSEPNTNIFNNIEPDTDEILSNNNIKTSLNENIVEKEDSQKKYRTRYMSTNAISLTNKIQIVIRFYGSVEEIHKNYDYVHCTCSYDYETNKVNLPAHALECIINKELRYIGSKYPLCSIIRSRKFIKRGYSISAGEYVKMCFQLNELDLKDINVFKDQLVGVDSAYFNQALEYIQQRMEKDPSFKLTQGYLFEIIDRIFN